MPDISAIIKKIDEHLEKNHLDRISAIETNIILEKAKLLRDSKSRRGLPLRDLLREGHIPHAYQMNGTFWFIPHSKSTKENLSNDKPVSEITIEQKSSVPTDVDIEQIKKHIELARINYKPQEIKCLLIAEAPPDSLDRFFYYEDVKDKDFLFLGVMEVLYSKLKFQYLHNKRRTDDKKELLEKFKSDGFYLIDLLDFPITYNGDNLSAAVTPFINKLVEGYIFNIPIIIIKTTVHSLLYGPLISKGFKKVAIQRIPFPAQGWSEEFKKKFREALEFHHINLIKENNEN